MLDLWLAASSQHVAVAVRLNADGVIPVDVIDDAVDFGRRTQRDLDCSACGNGSSPLEAPCLLVMAR
jgi:hypothetical protein